MGHLLGTDRSQLLLLPEAVDDYVGPDNPVRFIEAFVDGLDLAAAGFERVAAKETGRPGFDPADMLKLYIYGYVNRVRSSRRLEAEAHRNIEVIWLLRHLTPDFRTIAAFRRINRSAFKKVFREFVILCRQLDLFGRELLAVDGTRIKAVNNKDRNFTRSALSKFIREADEKLDDYIKRLDDSDAEEERAGENAAIRDKRTRHKAMLEELDRTGEDQISLVFGIFAALAEFERALIIERTKAGLAAARARGRNGGAPFKMTPAKLRLAQAAMGKPETKVADLCAELGITRQTLYRFVGPKGELRADGAKLLDRRKRGI